MRNWLLSITFIFSVLFSADVNLSIDNFTDDGAGNVTFDIMMTNTVPVGGFQFDFLSGNGQFDSGDDCRCDQGDDNLGGNNYWNSNPSCDECYYDYGVDKVRNNKESDTSTSGYSYGCENSGVCTDEVSSSSDCEDVGVCSDDSIDDSADCVDAGLCSVSEYESQCGCETNDGTWTPAENIWTPDNSYMTFDDIEDCFDNVNDDGEQLRWDYYNPDGNNDNYATVSVVEGFDQQRCHVPEYDSDFHSVEADDENYLIAGHCSEFNPICVSTGEYDTADLGGGVLLDWDISCCVNTSGGKVFEPWRDKGVCEGTVNVNNTDYELDLGYMWITYEDEATCESYGGFWYGSEDGTEGNEAYDMGEYFIDRDASLAIVSGSGGSSEANAFMISASGSTVLGFAFGGGTIPMSVTPVSLATFNAAYSGLTAGDVFELLSMSVCGAGELGDWSGTNCPNDLLISDSSSEPLTVDFVPSIWTVGYGISSIADDGICSSIGGWGEDSDDDSACLAYCGDGYCNNSEDFSTCSVDCDSFCGDGVCSLFEGNDNGDIETADTCPADCNVFGCGDFICSEGETISNCPYDCYNSFCGDGLCDIDGNENALNCYEDCQPVCGNGVCDEGENFSNCSPDCESICGDGIYDHAGVDYDSDGTVGAEDSDCEDYEITCGDGVYHYLGAEFNGLIATATGQCTGTSLDDCQAETFEDCPSDYAVTDNDGYYDYANGENQDSLDYTITSGDGYCDATSDNYSEDDAENPGTEEVCPSVCGDGFYDYLGLGGIEDETCVADYEVTQGDGYCDEANGEIIGETIDCPLPICGDGECEVPFENFTNCASDCNSFCGDGLYDHVGVDLDGDGIFGIEDDSCSADYGITCGDGVYDWEGGEIADGNDEGSEPDCDYAQTCGDGYYDYLAGELLACFDSETMESIDYVLTCGDGYCDYILLEYEVGGEAYCEIDCVVPGCTDSSACNYSQTATTDDGTCVFIVEGECDCDSNIAENGFDCEGNPLAIANIPVVFSLKDNYPNPFNPITTIEYSVEKAGNVNISIYNVVGHKVYDLVSGYHSPGIRYSIVWNSNTQSNIPVSTGIYFYEMRSGDYIERKKMALVK